mgnify:CR=1 FL=1
MSARIAPGGMRDTGPLAWAFARLAGRVTRTGPPAIFTTLGRGRGLFWGWLHFSARLMPYGALARRESELVILTVATERGNAYETAHHRVLGRRAGLTADEIDLLVGGDAPSSLTHREAVLRECALELVRTRDLADPTWARLRGVTSERESLELVMLVGQYDSLATTLDVLRITPDRPRR